MVRRVKNNESKDSEAEAKHLDCILYLYAESLRIMAILLQPFIPQMAKQMLDALEVARGSRSMEYARYGKDDDYCKTLNGDKKAPILFPALRVTEEEISKL